MLVNLFDVNLLIILKQFAIPILQTRARLLIKFIATARVSNFVDIAHELPFESFDFGLRGHLKPMRRR